MSFLREIIASAEEMEMQKLKQRVPELKCEMYIWKAEILKYLDEIYVHYLRKPTEMPHYSDKLKYSQEELNLIKRSLQHGIKKEPVCKDVLNNLNEYVQEIDIILLEINDLCSIHLKILDMKLYYSAQNYSESLQILKDVENDMKNTKFAITSKYFRKTIHLQKSSMFFDFGELISASFIISLKDEGNTSFLKFENNLEVNHLIQHLYQYDNHIRMLDKLSDFLWEFIFVPIITCIVQVTKTESELTIQVIKRHSKQNYNEVFKKLYKVTYFLQNYLNIILCESANVTLLEYIGNQLKDKFSPLLIGYCFQKIHPPDEGDQLDYLKLIEDTEKLLHELKFLGIMSDSSILEYARNLEQVHVNKQCDKFLNHAKMLMDQKFTEITQFGTRFLKDSSISDFPSFSISSIAQELLQLIEKMLMEMKDFPSIRRRRYFQTVFSILDYYMKNGRKYQEEMMAEQVALFHNNCKYIAHELEELNIFYSVIFQNDVNIPLFKNEAYQLLTIADESLNSFLNTEKNKLRNLFSNDIECTEEPWDLSKKSLRKYFLQIKYLKEAWCDILSPVVYNKSMGLLFNTICDFFITYILKLQNFETDDTRLKLSEIFIFVTNNAPLYFLGSDLKNFVHCWEKFTSISFILNSNLVEIETNWSSKESFLKSNLKINELKVLIKTFFEDSQKTIAFLSKIHG